MSLCTGAEPGDHPSRLPAVADQLPVAHLPSVGAPERGEDDQRGPQGPEGQHRPLLPHGPHLRPQLLQQLQQTGLCVCACMRACMCVYVCVCCCVSINVLVCLCMCLGVSHQCMCVCEVCLATIILPLYTHTVCVCEVCS